MTSTSPPSVRTAHLTLLMGAEERRVVAEEAAEGTARTPSAPPWARTTVADYAAKVGTRTGHQN